MPAENKINISIPPEVLAEVKVALQTIKTQLDPYLISLTPEQRRVLPKMSDKTFSFVMKVLSYVDTAPQFSPPYLDIPSLKTDMKAVEDMRVLFEDAAILDSNLDDSIMLSGSEAYVASLAYYDSVKRAARLNVPGAKVVYDDLKARFPGTKVAAEPSVN